MAFLFDGIFASDAPVKLQGRAVLQFGGLCSEMLGEKRAPQLPGYSRTPNGYVHLGMPGKRIRMQIAGANRCPHVVNEHELRVYVRYAATAFRVSSGDASEQEVLVATERFKPIEQRRPFRVQTSLVDMAFRICGNQKNDSDAALERLIETIGDRRDRYGLVFNVYRVTSSVDRTLVLLQDGAFSGRDIKWRSPGRGMSVLVAARMQHALDLRGVRSSWLRKTAGEGQSVTTVTCPVPILAVPFAGFVPALDEIVVDVGRGWPGHLNIDIMALAAARMAG